VIGEINPDVIALQEVDTRFGERKGLLHLERLERERNDGAKALRKPVFTTVDQLRPQTHGHTLTARVISARTVLDKPSTHLGRTRVAECLVGDSTGTVLVTARNEQVDLLEPDTTVIFRNAKIDMFKGTMRLAVDKWGRIEVTQPADFKVNQDNNMSLVEYELVDVDEEE